LAVWNSTLARNSAGCDVGAEPSVARRPVTAVLIDEVQFMTADQVHQLAWIVDELKIPVMAYGLKNNVYGTLFSGAITTIMALADDFQEIKQLCHCGRKATMILKYDRNGEAVRSGEVVEIGGEGRYVSVCRPPWTKGDLGPAARQFLAQAAAAE
jgi:thymidine kinase